MSLLQNVLKQPTQTLWRRFIIGAVIATGITIVVLLVILAAVTVFSEPAGDDFPELEQSASANRAAIESMQLFRINGTESSNDWVQVHDEKMSVTGFLVNVEGELTSRDFRRTTHLELAIIVPETIEGVTIYHLVSFLRTPETTYNFLDWDDRVDDIDDALIFERNFSIPAEGDSIAVNPSLGFQLVHVDFSIHDGWLRADHIGSYWRLFYLYSDYSGILRRPIFPTSPRGAPPELKDQDSIWLDASKGQTTEVKGAWSGNDFMYISYRREKSTLNSLPDGEYARVYVRVPAKLGTATIDHLVPVYFQNRQDVQPFKSDDLALAGWGVTVPVTVKYDVLVFSEGGLKPYKR